jgi:hypothetical protein
MLDSSLMHRNLLPNQTRNLLIRHRIHIRLNGVLPRRRLLRNLRLLQDLDFPLLKRTRQIHRSDLVAQPDRLLHQLDEPEGHLQLDVRPIGNVLLQVALRLDREALPDNWRVGADVNIVDVQDVVVGSFAVDQGILAWDGGAGEGLLRAAGDVEGDGGGEGC